jgi:hypothetical protein
MNIFEQFAQYERKQAAVVILAWLRSLPTCRRCPVRLPHKSKGHLCSECYYNKYCPSYEYD